MRFEAMIGGLPARLLHGHGAYARTLQRPRPDPTLPATNHTAFPCCHGDDDAEGGRQREGGG